MLLDAAEHPGKAFVKCKGKGQNKMPDRGKDDRKDIEKVIDIG